MSVFVHRPDSVTSHLFCHSAVFEYPSTVLDEVLLLLRLLLYTTFCSLANRFAGGIAARTLVNALETVL